MDRQVWIGWCVLLIVGLVEFGRSEYQLHSYIHAPNDTDVPNFGWGGGLSKDSKTLFVSSFCPAGCPNNRTSIFVYSLTDALTWRHDQELDLPPNAPINISSSFGANVMSDSGNTIVGLAGPYNGTGYLVIWTRDNSSEKFSIANTTRVTSYSMKNRVLSMWKDQRIVIGGSGSTGIYVTEKNNAVWGTPTFINITSAIAPAGVFTTQDYIYCISNYSTLIIFKKEAGGFWKKVSEALQNGSFNDASFFGTNNQVFVVYLDRPGGTVNYKIGSYSLRNGNWTQDTTYYYNSYNFTRYNTPGFGYGFDVALIDNILLASVRTIPGYIYLYDTTKNFTRLLTAPRWDEGDYPCKQSCGNTIAGFGSRISTSQFLIASFYGPDRSLYNGIQYFTTGKEAPKGTLTDDPHGSAVIYIDPCKAPNFVCYDPPVVNNGSAPNITVGKNTTVLIINVPIVLNNRSVVQLSQGQIINSSACITFAGTLSYSANSTGVNSGNETVTYNLINFDCGTMNETSQFQSIEVQDENECQYKGEGVYEKTSFSLLIVPSSSSCREDHQSSHTLRTVLIAVLVPVLVITCLCIILFAVGGVAYAYYKKRLESV